MLNAAMVDYKIDFKLAVYNACRDNNLNGLMETLGLHGAFWLYARISCVGLFSVVMFVPETKGKDLDEMDPKYVQTMTINR